MPESSSPWSRISTKEFRAIVFPNENSASERADAADRHLCVIVDAGNAHKGQLPRIRVRGKEYEVCWRSLFIFPVHGAFRQRVISFVEWKVFENFILVLIALNSAFLASYQYRQDENQGFNAFVNNIAEIIFLVFFTLELVLKVIAWGLFLDPKSYLRDRWNWLDFIVVVSGLIQRTPWLSGGGLGFLRLFRILRPLRSLNAMPQMKVLVNTVISSVPRLSYVSGVAAALFVIFGIIGTTLMDGIFYRGCRTSANPVLLTQNGTSCWSWPYVEICDGGECSPDRLCGGRYMCEDSGGFCGGREDDTDWTLRPAFPDSPAPGVDENPPYDNGCAPGFADRPCTYRRGFEWCEDSVPRKQYPETDFIHFDHMGGALLTLFQCMTMEGWVDIMYFAQDGYSYWMGTIYFFSFNAVASIFLLNIALAVVDEAREDFEEDDEDEADQEDGDRNSQGSLNTISSTIAVVGGRKQGDDDDDEEFEDEEVWLDRPWVIFLHRVAMNEVFNNVILFFILANVVTMALEQYPPKVELEEFSFYAEIGFLVVFVIEMIIMVGALGPKGYVTNPMTCFDGFIVTISLAQEVSQVHVGPLTVLRTLRLLRVMNKLANRWPSFKVLLKAIGQTAKSLINWIILFLLVLYICTLMWMEFFNRQFHFRDPDAFDMTDGTVGEPWCNGMTGDLDLMTPLQQRLAQDCIPRAHFDTFLWSFLTIFQIMTGENWNTVMYAGIRSRWDSRSTFFFMPELMAFLFVLLILFGQILFLSLFLSMLISKFDKVQDALEEKEMEKIRLEKLRRNSFSRRNSQERLFASKSMGPWTFMSSFAKNLNGGSSESQGNVVQIVPSETLDSGSAALKPQLDDVRRSNNVGILPGQPEPQLDDDDCAASPPNKGGTQNVVKASKPWQVGSEEIEHVVDVTMDGDDLAADQSAPQASCSIESIPNGQGSAAKVAPDPAIMEEAETASQKSEDSFRMSSPKEEARAKPGAAHDGSVGSASSGHSALVAVHAKRGWPRGYAWFILHKDNCLRKACMWVLTKEVRIGDTRINIFDNFILLCIIVSSICMILDSPLRHRNVPDHWEKEIFYWADWVFNFIFIVEMAIKLLALGLWWGKDAYLKSGWNWLDAIVVIVSIIDMTATQSSNFLKTLRILRAFRPLRVISRNENLKIVVQTMFGAMPDLVTLIVVSMLILLIFALFLLQYLRGKFFHCQPGPADVVLMQDLGSHFVTPLCLAGNATISACPHGDFQVYPDYTVDWHGDGARPCPSNNQLCTSDAAFSWKRATMDTPICIGRCDKDMVKQNPDFWKGREWLCEEELTSVNELPSECSSRDSAEYFLGFSPEEVQDINRGWSFIEKMQRAIVMPCGGSTVVDGNLTTPEEARLMSCRNTFCGDESEISQDTKDTCRYRCSLMKGYQHTCFETCSVENPSPEQFAQCESCKQECEAACQCEDFCEPLIRDAAVCSEQGGQWKQSLSQSFDNVWYAFLTLFEIMSTEGWVDVMYAATDAKDYYMEPVRDNQLVFAVIISVYIFFSFFFLLNLSVGVITDRYMDLKEAGQETTLTESQKKWIKSNLNLFKRPLLFNVTDLHLLPKWRRRVYDFIASRHVDRFIMACIILNTVSLGLKVFPEGLKYQKYLEWFNIVLALVFLIEFALKLYAYRANYWKDIWNRFDFFCVVATFIGLIVRLAGAPLGTVAGVLRSFRIARLFRFYTGLNKIFTALILSIPKLSNVFLVFMLFLVLFSILGVNLFAPMKLSETHNVHGNFRDFPQAFITLYRASTGEAWNEIMHDLRKSPEDYFREGTWCTPSELWDTSDWATYQALEKRCLIDNPNSCPTYLFFPIAFFVMYTLLISYLVMNLLVAVILDGYEDGKPSHESEVIDMSIDLWREFDPDQTLYADVDDAMAFIAEMVYRGMEHGHGDREDDVTSPLEWIQNDATLMRIKYLRAFQNMTLSMDGKVHFLVALKQVLRLVCAKDDIMTFVELEGRIDQEQVPADVQKELKQLKSLELKSRRRIDTAEISVQQHFAVIAIQRMVREKVLQMRARRAAENAELGASSSFDTTQTDSLQLVRPDTADKRPNTAG